MSKHFVLENSYKLLLESIGINAEWVFKKSEIPYKTAKKDGISISLEQFIKFMNTLDEVIDDKIIIEYTDIDRVMMFVPPLFAAMCAKDGINCFKTISKYKKLIGPFVLNVNTNNEKISMEFMFDNNNLEIPRFSIISEQVLITNIIRKATGLSIVPTKVASKYEYGHELEKFFGIKPEKCDSNLIEFSLKDAKEPFLTSNNIMWGYLEPELTKRIKELELDESFSAKVRSLLIELIPAGEDGINSVAKEMALSVRSLQRKLANENTTFIKQLNHTKKLLARNYLKDKNISNEEIAFLIGYSDENAFRRAFRNWTGTTPREYRDKYSDIYRA
ncbi:AraC-type DNA-binding protein [Petrocella atlantisensis]|uniref:AraC-type DNA-binding protein n=1 Tax=Petrocella atlantisensis TaxID=2173034 RepID=A0A3P7P107_9FIRM|nr:helix-turn-helix transcriptional regulator [Petrocella atlantisensis]VDN47150.1 AraC-type DNA-binding protein [Petrocella atlantisensis]